MGNAELLTRLLVLSLHLVEKLLENLTGLAVVEVDMCPNSCIAYTRGYAFDDVCLMSRDVRQPDGAAIVSTVCNAPRYKAPNKPARQLIYIPVEPRIEALFKDPRWAELLTTPFQLLRDAIELAHEAMRRFHDFPSGDTVKTLRHLFYDAEQDKEHVCLFTLSTDGAQLKLQKSSGFWLLLVVLINIPITEGRLKQENTFILAAIPGPLAPVDLESFMAPFYQEMARAHVGVWMWDAHQTRWFKWHAYLLAVLGDMLGSAKCNGMKGHQGYAGCRFCMIVGARRSSGDRTMYYILKNLRERNNAGQLTRINAERPDAYDAGQLPLRTHRQYRDQLREIQNAPTENAGKKLQRQYGIIKQPLATVSRAFLMPSFFPIDGAHLPYADVTPTMYDRWTLTSKRRNDERFALTREQQVTIGMWMDRSSGNLPACFVANAPRNIFLKRNTQYKLHEWVSWAHYYSIPLLEYVGFPPDYIEHWALFVAAMELSLRPQALDSADVDLVQEYLAQFCEQNEVLYIADDVALVNRAPMCIHQLLHVADHLRWLGSLRHYSQYPMERTVGQVGRMVHSQKEPWANMVNELVIHARIQLLSLIYPQISPPLDPPPEDPVLDLNDGQHSFRLIGRIRAGLFLETSDDAMAHQENLALVDWLRGQDVAAAEQGLLRPSRWHRWGKMERRTGPKGLFRSQRNESPRQGSVRTARYFKVSYALLQR